MFSDSSFSLELKKNLVCLSGKSLAATGTYCVFFSVYIFLEEGGDIASFF
jgi:hypothetical protein